MEVDVEEDVMDWKIILLSDLKVFTTGVKKLHPDISGRIDTNEHISGNECLLYNWNCAHCEYI